MNVVEYGNNTAPTLPKTTGKPDDISSHKEVTSKWFNPENTERENDKTAESGAGTDKVSTSKNKKTQNKNDSINKLNDIIFNKLNESDNSEDRKKIVAAARLAIRYVQTNMNSGGGSKTLKSMNCYGDYDESFYNELLKNHKELLQSVCAHSDTLRNRRFNIFGISYTRTAKTLIKSLKQYSQQIKNTTQLGEEAETTLKTKFDSAQEKLKEFNTQNDLLVYGAMDAKRDIAHAGFVTINGTEVQITEKTKTLLNNINSSNAEYIYPKVTEALQNDEKLKEYCKNEPEKIGRLVNMIIFAYFQTISAVFRPFLNSQNTLTEAANSIKIICNIKLNEGEIIFELTQGIKKKNNPEPKATDIMITSTHTIQLKQTEIEKTTTEFYKLHLGNTVDTVSNTLKSVVTRLEKVEL